MAIHRTIRLVGVVFAVAVLTACGPGPSPAPITSPTPTAPAASGGTALPTSIDPCHLLTTKQASALNGVAYKSGSADTPSGGLSMCSWDNASAEATVEVGFAFWPTISDAQAAYAALTSGSPPGSTVTALSGLGDAAVISRGTAATVPGQDGIFVRRGPLVVMISYYNGTAPGDSALREAATRVLAELPHVAG